MDDILRQSHRIFENLSYLREVVIAQQNAMSEQRARLARGSQVDEEYHSMSDDYKGLGYTGGDAKKRRVVSPMSCQIRHRQLLTKSTESCPSRTMPQL